ncbi:MAG: 4-aminobutyrate--2-oxoglutarate transaminase [Gammaproteobacteria bacterium]|nr:4-aminobutyrate--2-oxoglutarate transaminase [Gammaproteobacteria bacterium]MCP5318760.1 4-aminobutyrate--2-oxoglutarate transaminase [Chromatiaceae bacterium]MCP5429797.1 4-aminobutyrate--2-oxoglutarate transaminase [Chromatiaceae bacterium]MCP5435551.1 4-aminobutyrate--2-oxoglutarate transaminase [Chromatiaceae bacterium]
MSTIKLVTAVPGPNSMALVARRDAAVSRGSARLTGIAVASGDGAAVTDVDGNTFLDFAGGIGTLAAGHVPPTVVDAIRDQAGRLIHMCSIVATYEPYVEVCERLNACVPGDFDKKTTLLNSGAEAVETAVKVARAYTGRQALIVFEGAYHGRTNLTLGMTSKYALFKNGFGPFPSEVYRLPFPNPYRRPAGMSEDDYVQYCIDQFDHALIAQVAPQAVAAVVVETVQGEGGFLPLPPRFAAHLRARCSEHGMLFVADEVQCGMGRTGRLFAVEHYGLVPDLLVSGKSIAGGMPLAAVTGRAEIMDAPNPGGLGGTYSGNPVACAAALAAIDMLDSPAFRARALEVGQRIRGHLDRLQADHPDVIGEVRGLGPMLAMELVRDPVSRAPDAALTNAITAETLKRGLITIRAGLYSNCLRLLPALTLSDAQIDEGMAVLAEAVAAARAAA